MAATAIPQVHDLAILFGSDTGTAQDVAERIGREAGRRGFRALVSSMDEFPIAALPSKKLAIFVLSTTGDGEVPANMKAFWAFLLQRGLPKTALASLKFSLFGLGDSGYAKFNAAARMLHQRLLQLGAVEFSPRGLGDDQSEPLGMDGDLEAWLKLMWPALLALHPLPEGAVVDDSPELLRCRYRVQPAAAGAPASAAGDTATAAGEAAAAHKLQAPHIQSLKPPHDAYHPADSKSPIFLSRLRAARRLTAQDWSQDVRHLEFDVSAAGAQHQPGDIATIWPLNPPALVQRLCVRLGVDPTTDIQVSLATAAQGCSSQSGSECRSAWSQPPEGTATPTSPLLSLPSHLTVADLFSRYLGIAEVPKRGVFEQLSFFVVDDDEAREKLVEISAPGGADLYATYVKQEHRNIVEILEDFPSLSIPISMFLELLPAQKPRHYSIASAQSLNPGRVELCVGLVDYSTKFQRRIKGVCSSFLASLAEGDEVCMSLRPGTLRIPGCVSRAFASARGPSQEAAAQSDSAPAPLILIGPGTGVAPMRSLLQEVACHVKLQPGARLDTRLYFGCRRSAKDHLYADDWAQLQSDGALSVYRPAFSRDQATKQYVQTQLWADRADVALALAHPECHVFIAGSAKRMPTDVVDILQMILQRAGKSEAEAKQYTHAMQRQNRLIIEAWS